MKPLLLFPAYHAALELLLALRPTGSRVSPAARHSPAAPAGGPRRARTRLAPALIALLAPLAALGAAGCSDGSSSVGLSSGPGFDVPSYRLPDGQEGVLYSFTITSNGGRAPVRYTIVSGAPPQGLSLDPDTGVLSGTPAQEGAVAEFRVRAEDADGLFAEADYRLVIAKRVTITTAAALPNAQVNRLYNVTLTASGGDPPYGWTLLSGSLPPGVILNRQSGTLVGTPQVRGTFTFTIEAGDVSDPITGQAFDARTFTLVVA